MMWITIFTLLLAIQGLTASELGTCDIQKCLEDVPEHVKNRPLALPDVEDLEELCPIALTAIECTVNVLEDCVGKTVHEIADSEDRYDSSSGKMILSIRRLYTDMCDKETRFHKDLMQTGPCIKLYNEDVNYDDCYEEAHEAYSVYEQFLEAHPEEHQLRGPHSRSCIVQSFSMACQVVNLKQQCGEAAVNVAKKFIKEIKALGHNTVCSPEDVQALKSKFLDLLDLEEENRNVFSAVMDIKRKK